MAKVGDLVRYLNTVGGGRIVRIDGAVAYIDEDGFENPVMLKECVVVSPASTHVPPPANIFAKKVEEAPSAPSAPSKDVTPKPKPETFVVEETPGGEKLNVVLGYVPIDIKRLSTTAFEAYLVNDSNFYLAFTYLTRSSEDKQWTLRYSGVVEPGIQVFLAEVAREDLAEMDHVAIQYIAYKLDKPFDAKTPAFVDLKLDTTKFFKLHCFQPNMYFDEPVIALNVVSDDRPAKALEVNPKDLEQAMRSKINTDRVTKRPVQKHKPKADEPLVVDLHIAELVDNTRGLSNADMLNLQIDTFRRVMDENLKNHGRKIIFIHGKGDGVLRKALLKELVYRYKGHDAQDASFQEYGYGATQVKIR